VGPSARSLSMAAFLAHDDRRVRQVWAHNLNEEFGGLLDALAACGPGAYVALDMEFPGLPRERPEHAAREGRYQALRRDADLLQPVQLGLALADAGGALRGAWSFNFRFDVATHLHTEAAIAFLHGAGVDFPQHAAEGIDPAALGWRLVTSPVVGAGGNAPWCVTFAGFYDLGYLLKLLTGQPLPRSVAAFDAALAGLCPQRYELRDWLPHGSLEFLLQEHRLERQGSAHTAGSDALATMELFLRVVPAEARATTDGVDVEANSGGPPVAPCEPEEEPESSRPPAEEVAPAPARAQARLAGASAAPAPAAPAHQPPAREAAAGSVSWGAAARFAMPDTGTSGRAGRAAPSRLWGVAARAAASEARAAAGTWRGMQDGSRPALGGQAIPVA